MGPGTTPPRHGRSPGSRLLRLAVTPLLGIVGLAVLLVLGILPAWGRRPKASKDVAAPVVKPVETRGPLFQPRRARSVWLSAGKQSSVAAASILRARSRYLSYGVGPLLIFFGLALVSGSFSLAGFAQGNSQGTWEGFDCREFHTWPQLPEDEEDFGEYLGKDVGAFEAALVPLDPNDDQSFTIGVTGAYPSYGIICEIAFTVGVQGGPDVELGLPLIKPLVGLTCDTPRPTGLDCDEMTVILTAPDDGECVSPGTEHEATLVFHVEQPAKEATNYAFGVEIPAFDCGEEIEDREDPETPRTPDKPQQSTTPRTDEVQGVQVTPGPIVRELPSTGSGGFAGMSTDGTIGLVAIVVGILIAYGGIRARSL